MEKYRQGKKYIQEKSSSKCLEGRILFEKFFQNRFCFGKKIIFKYALFFSVILFPVLKLLALGDPLLVPGIRFEAAIGSESEIDFGGSSSLFESSSSLFSLSSLFYIKRFSGRVFIEYREGFDYNKDSSSLKKQSADQSGDALPLCCSFGLLPGYRINENLSINLGGIFYFGSSNFASNKGSIIGSNSGTSNGNNNGFHNNNGANHGSQNRYYSGSQNASNLDSVIDNAEFSGIVTYVSQSLYSYFEVKNRNHIRWLASVPVLKNNSTFELALQFSGENFGSRNSLRTGVGIQYKQVGLHVYYDYLWQAVSASLSIENRSGLLVKLDYIQKEIATNSNVLVSAGVTYRFLNKPGLSSSTSPSSSLPSSHPRPFPSMFPPPPLLESSRNSNENNGEKKYRTKNRKRTSPNRKTKGRPINKKFKKKRRVVPNFSTLISWGVSSKDALKILRSKDLCSGSLKSQKIIKNKGWKCAR